MPTLPLTVTDVIPRGAELYAVVVAFADGTTANYLIPTSMATIEGVTISALAMGVLSDPNRTPSYTHHRGHRRYLPRP